MVKSTLEFTKLWCAITDPSSALEHAIYDFSVKRIIYDSFSPKLQLRFRAYPYNASSLWQALHHLFSTPTIEEDAILSSSEDVISEEESIVDDDLEESCSDSNSLE